MTYISNTDPGLAFSEKLQAYIKKVIQHTKRHVEIRLTSKDIGVKGIYSRFVENPVCIHIDISPLLKSKESFEQSIAHEVTHGLLRYGLNYCGFKVKNNLTPEQSQTASLLGTMIEDIVVEKILVNEGFRPFPDNYPSVIEQETNAIIQGKDYYHQFSDPIFKERFMVFRYIAAWSTYKYIRLENNERIIFNTFLNAFIDHFPKQYKATKFIKKAIVANNIFSPEGYKTILNICIQLWNLEKVIETT